LHFAFTSTFDIRCSIFDIQFLAAGPDKFPPPPSKVPCRATGLSAPHAE
jgi:hypothetical protein